VNPVSGATKDVPVISGHRDWEATACPGGRLYSQLATIRADVAQRNNPSSPVAITSASCTGKACTFSAVGTPVLRWKFGNGTSATGSPVKATYTAKGTYTVTVTDGQSPSTTAKRSVVCKRVNGALRCTT